MRFNKSDILTPQHLAKNKNIDWNGTHSVFLWELNMIPGKVRNIFIHWFVSASTKLNILAIYAIVCQLQLSLTPRQTFTHLKYYSHAFISRPYMLTSTTNSQRALDMLLPPCSSQSHDHRPVKVTLKELTWSGTAHNLTSRLAGSTPTLRWANTQRYESGLRVN